MKVISRSEPSSLIVRSIDMTGVMPLPPETNRTLLGAFGRKCEVATDSLEPDDHAGGAH